MEFHRVVDMSDLDESNDGNYDTLLNGKLFSGVAFELCAATGGVVSLLGFRNGRLHGPLRGWAPSGVIVEEKYYYLGGYHGPRRRWHEDGQLAESCHSEYDVNWRTKRWGEDGRLLEEKHLVESDPRWRRIEEADARYANRIVDIDLSTLSFFERPKGWGRDESDLPPPPGPPSRALLPTK